MLKRAEPGRGVMYTQIRDDETGGRHAMAQDRRGITIFYVNHLDYRDVDGTYFLGTPEGLAKTDLSYVDMVQCRDVFDSWTSWHISDEPGVKEVFVLKYTKHVKELGPQYFAPQENTLFRNADAEEWKQWLLNGSVKLVPQEEANNLPRENIFTAPMRFVLANKATAPGSVQAKSRLTTPGHMDPQSGLYRTDAPTTSGLAVLTMVAIAVCYGWLAEIFDVTTAFLSGKALERLIHVRAPTDGLPGVPGHAPVGASRLLQILKSSYGLSEAPQLWYLRARELLLEVGFVELQCAKTVHPTRSLRSVSRRTDPACGRRHVAGRPE